LREEHKLKVFGNMIRKIFGPTSMSLDYITRNYAICTGQIVLFGPG
jgi:hypothetical protein